MTAVDYCHQEKIVTESRIGALSKDAHKRCQWQGPVNHRRSDSALYDLGYIFDAFLSALIDFLRTPWNNCVINDAPGAALVNCTKRY